MCRADKVNKLASPLPCTSAKRAMLFERVLFVAVLMTAASGETFTWTTISASASSPQPPARHSAAMGSMGGTFYVFGGRGNMMNGTRVLGEKRSRGEEIVL